MNSIKTDAVVTPMDEDSLRQRHYDANLAYMIREAVKNDRVDVVLDMLFDRLSYAVYVTLPSERVIIAERCDQPITMPTLRPVREETWDEFSVWCMQRDGIHLTKMEQSKGTYWKVEFDTIHDAIEFKNRWY